MAALTGIRVLDLTRVVSGPFASMLLGDLGAEVIKVEALPRGDDSRAFGPPFVGGGSGKNPGGESAYFLSVNRNKRSVAINLRDADGIALVWRLAGRCDVLLDNFRPGVMRAMGLDHRRLRVANPRLISCSVSGFGAGGPDAQRPAYDLILQGESGVMDVTGQPDGPPTKIGASLADLITGQFAAQGVMAALLERAQTGHGRHVEVAMLDCMAAMLTFNAGIYFATGQSPARRGNTHAAIAPYETFAASDGWVNIGVANDKFWRLFCGCVGRADWIDDPRYATASARVRHRDTLIPAIAALIAARPRQYWLDALGEAGVPVGDIRSVGEVCDAAQLTSRGQVLATPHATAGLVKSIANPLRFDDAPITRATPPPLFGQHTDAVLRELLGMDATQIDALCARGVVRCLPKESLP